MDKRADKALAIQSTLEDAFGSHPFYKKLALMAALQDASYQGILEGRREILERIPNNQAIDKASIRCPDGSNNAWNEGIQYIINKVTAHE